MSEWRDACIAHPAAQQVTQEQIDKLKKDLKDTIFGFGPLQDLLRAPAVTEIMVVGRDQIYVERDGVIEKSMGSGGLARRRRPAVS